MCCLRIGASIKLRGGGPATKNSHPDEQLSFLVPGFTGLRSGLAFSLDLTSFPSVEWKQAETIKKEAGVGKGWEMMGRWVCDFPKSPSLSLKTRPSLLLCVRFHKISPPPTLDMKVKTHQVF